MNFNTNVYIYETYTKSIRNLIISKTNLNVSSDYNLAKLLNRVLVCEKSYSEISVPDCTVKKQILISNVYKKYKTLTSSTDFFPIV